MKDMVEAERYKAWKEQDDIQRAKRREQEIFDYYSKLPREELLAIRDIYEDMKNYPGYNPMYGLLDIINSILNR